MLRFCWRFFDNIEKRRENGIVRKRKKNAQIEKESGLAKHC